MNSRRILVLALLSALSSAGCMQNSAPAPAAEAMAAAPASGDMAAPAATAGMAMASDAAPMSTAHYQVTFASRWTAANHPLEYPAPEYLGLAVAHFSGLIGASHKAGYSLFAEGSKPSAGLERLSEMGKHDPLNDEIAAAIQSGQALAMVESTEPLKDHSKTETADVAVDTDHSRVSLVAMIAPSPDWFAGVKDVDLMENGQWVAEKTLDVMPFDSGGDDGTTYRADDVDTDPKKPTTSLNGNPHFTYNGKFLPVATVTFKKI
jgi:hypothetical protein